MTIINNAQGGESLEIKVEKSLAVIEWKKETVITWAKMYTAKYQGLAMTDENVDEIKEVCADLQRKIKRLDEIRLEQGRAFKAPLDKFTAEINEVKKVISDVRDPLFADISKFEETQRQIRVARIKSEIQFRTQDAGLREKFAAQLTEQDSWSNKGAFNKTFITKSVLAEIDGRTATLLELQKQEDQAAEMRRQREEMAVMMCRLQSEAAGLAVAIEPKDIYGISNLTLSDLPAAITTAVSRRKESEQAAIDRAERQKVEAAERELKRLADAEAAKIKAAEIDAAREAIARVEAQQEAVNAAEELPFAPPAPAPEKQYKMNVTIFGTEKELTQIGFILEDNGWNCVFGGREEVKGAA